MREEAELQLPDCVQLPLNSMAAIDSLEEKLQDENQTSRAVRNNHFTKQATEDEFASVAMNWLRYAKD
ncbi:UNVERIFIED_CONTAM: hypothetical protein FKN15_075154 [Acipenser sinensis]